MAEHGAGEKYTFGGISISVVHKYLTFDKKMTTVPGCRYINSSSGSYFLETVGSGGLSINDGDGNRVHFGKPQTNYSGGARIEEKFYAGSKGGTIYEYSLRDKKHAPVLTSEHTVRGAIDAGAIAYISQTGCFAVLDKVSCQITIEQYGGAQLQVINKMENGEQILGDPWNIIAGVSDVESVIISDRGDDNIPQSVACLELHPPRIKWREWINDPHNLWCVKGLILVSGSNIAERSLLVLSAQSGKLLGSIQSDWVPNGVTVDSDGNVLIMSYVVARK